MRTRFTRSLCRVLAAVLGTTLATPAHAEHQNNQTDPTGWWWLTNVTLDTINDRIDQGYRMVDIEVEDDNPLRMSAAFVQNSGPYAKGWWWYYGQTATEVSQRITDLNAVLVDVEPYQTASGTRYAIVLIPNSGSDAATGHWWRTAQTFQQVADFVNNPQGRRVLDIQPYRDGSNNLRYAFTYVNNSGNYFESWWALYMNTTTAFLSDRLSANNARLVDFEPHDDTGTFTGLMVRSDGEYWGWFHGLVFDDISRLVNSYASRITDLQRYRTTGGQIRYGLVMRQNDNDLAVETAWDMRSHLPLGADGGFLLREFNGATSTIAGINEDEIFEPASLLKTVHHFAAMREVALGNLSLSSTLTQQVGATTICPTTLPVFPMTAPNFFTNTLSPALRAMMEQSSNPATEAVRFRLGTALIENHAAAWGATDVDLNHTIGCLCGRTRNEVTLRDLADIHEGVIDGALGGFRDEFYDLMSNGTGFGMGAFGTTAVLNDELAASSLSASQQNEFRSLISLAHKGGSYTCIFNGDREEHRSRGAYVSLPHRSGCATFQQEYFIGAWTNDADTAAQAEDATGHALTNLFRDRVRAAIDSWESAVCPCNPADLAAPYGILNSSDVNAFVNAFLRNTAAADLAAPRGIWNSSDVNAFVAAFLAGCP